ncbi:MAG: uracil-DNA glycosylase [Bdellovibrionales bacterium]
MASCTEPAKNCTLCPRLAQFRAENRAQYPGYHNAPVPSFGSDDPQLLIVALAPSLEGGNKTGRPFTGDSGALLYGTLDKLGLTRGANGNCASDGYQLVDTRITNAIRCVPPKNKPTPQEFAACNRFFAAEIATLRRLQVIIALGKDAHEQVIKTCDLKQKDYAFGHGCRHTLPLHGRTVALIDSFHCSRYNLNTKRLTPEMFEAVFVQAQQLMRA